MSLLDRLDRVGAALRERLGARTLPDTAVMLGSGLGAMAEEASVWLSLSYEELPGFPPSTVEGHAGRLVIGVFEDRPLIILQGRFHLYEGHSAAEVAFPIRALIRAGLRRLIVTNAAGGVDPAFAAGDLMLITDHLNFSGANPLVGEHDAALGPRFPDMTTAYTPALQDLGRRAAEASGVPLREGVYAVLGGPSYETPAEVRAMASLGASAVGMSTVFEVIACAQMGCEVLGLSLISNLAAGIGPQALSHAEVVEVGRAASGKFLSLLRAVVRALPGP